MKSLMRVFATVFCVALLAAGKPDLSQYHPIAQCEDYFGHFCANWVLAPWLPDLKSDSTARESAAKGRDYFLYNGHVPPQPVGNSRVLMGGQGPEDGTFFVYGKAGPPKGRVAYDRVHRIVFYEQGCCAWSEVVLAYAPPPPKSVVLRRLDNVHTVRGLRLGMSASDVFARYGRTNFHRVAYHANLQMASYTTGSTDPEAKDPCGQIQNLVFRTNRLIFIRLEDAC